MRARCLFAEQPAAKGADLILPRLCPAQVVAWGPELVRADPVVSALQALFYALAAEEQRSRGALLHHGAAALRTAVDPSALRAGLEAAPGQPLLCAGERGSRYCLPWGAAGQQLAPACRTLHILRRRYPPPLANPGTCIAAPARARRRDGRRRRGAAHVVRAGHGRGGPGGAGRHRRHLRPARARERVLPGLPPHHAGPRLHAVLPRRAGGRAGCEGALCGKRRRAQEWWLGWDALPESGAWCAVALQGPLSLAPLPHACRWRSCGPCTCSPRTSPWATCSASSSNRT